MGGALALGLCLGLLGCGEDAGGADFSGSYEVLTHTRNTRGCEGAGSAFSGDKFFELRADNGVLGYHRCGEPGDCSVRDESRSFDEPSGEEWRKVAVSFEQFRDYCQAELSERVARFEEGVLRLEGKVYRGEVLRVDGERCEEALVVSRRDELECAQREALSARRVEQD